MQQVLSPVPRKDCELWGRQPTKLQHTLHEREIFGDASIADLIEALPADHVTFTTMTAEGHDFGSWRYGERGELSGTDVLEAVRRGRLWINLSNVNQVDPRFADIVEEMFEELHHTFPDFTTSRQTLGILISSPNAQVFYHADVPGQGLWQIRGSKRVWIYPNTEPFLPPEELEKVVCRRQTEDISYEPWFEEYAGSYDLAPGEMLHWPLNGPHRVQNHDCVNVSLTTEHWTPEIRRHYQMNYANGVLRSLGRSPRSRSTTGAAFWSKAALGMAWRKSGIGQRQHVARRIEFQVDPAAPDSVRSLR